MAAFNPQTTNWYYQTILKHSCFHEKTLQQSDFQKVAFSKISFARIFA